MTNCPGHTDSLLEIYQEASLRRGFLFEDAANGSSGSVNLAADLLETASSHARSQHCARKRLNLLTKFGS
jgi:hypothetical protein